MKNVIDYVKETLMDFYALPFGERDSLVLSCLAYLHLLSAEDRVNSWEGLPLKELFRAEFFEGMLSKVNHRGKSLRCSPPALQVRASVI